MKRTLSMVLLLAMLASIASCGGSEGTADTTTASGGDNGTTAADVTTELTDGLPDKDMEGFSFNILNADETQLFWGHHNMIAEEETGELVNDAIYKRNRYIEDRFNCTLNITELPDNIGNMLPNIVMSGTNEYDLALIAGRQVISNLDYIADFNNIPYLNLDAAHWNPYATPVFNAGGKQLAAAGNFVLCYASSACCMMFNKEIYEDLQIKENLYELVREGKWTTDKFFEIARLGVRDLNGDTVMDKNDRMGVTATSLECYYGSLIHGAGFKFADNSDENYYEYSVGGNEKMISFMQKLLDVTFSDPYLYYTTATAPGAGDKEIKFENGQSLFYVSMMVYVSNYRDMTADFGIVPIPKYDENQEQYLTRGAAVEVSVLPRSYDESRIDNIGMLLEAMAFHSQQNLLPTYKEVMVQTKLTRDDESAEMIDHIFNGVVLDAGMHLIGTVNTTIMTNIYLNRQDVLISTIDSLEGAFNGEVQTIKDKIDEVP